MPGSARPATCRSRRRRPGTSAWEPAIEACRRARRARRLRGARRRGGATPLRSPVFRGAAFYPGAATVQPARLARASRERVRERGVEIYEHTPLGSCAGRGADVVAETTRGRVRAKAAVLASGGALAGLPGHAPPPHAHLEPHRGHRAGARGPRGDRLDRRRVHHRLAGDDPLLPHHPRRADRVRLGRRQGRPSAPAPHGRAERDPGVVARGRAPSAPFLPRPRGQERSSMPGAGRSTSRRATCP